MTERSSTRARPDKTARSNNSAQPDKANSARSDKAAKETADSGSLTEIAGAPPRPPGVSGIRGALLRATRALRSMRARSGRPGRLRRALPWLVAGVIAVVLLGEVVSAPLDHHLRRVLEAKINSSLHGYKVRLGSAHLRPYTLALSLRDLTVRQEANPEPPVAVIPHLKASVEWYQLLRGHLVADATFVRPRLHVDLVQVEEEQASQVPFQQRGWKPAFESIYPLKFNRVSVLDGEVTYVDLDPSRPLEVTRLQLEARNIRIIQSRDRSYPSPLHVQAVLFGSGFAAIDGNADFLAQPFFGVQGRYVVRQVPIDRFRPIVARTNISLQGGILSSHGEFEHGPRVYLLHVADVTIRGAHADYIHASNTAAAESRRGAEIARRVRILESQPPFLVFRVDGLHLADSDVGLINRDRNYRIYVDHADLDATNLSNQPREGPAKALLRGRFMGGGTGRAEATYRDGAGGPDLSFSLAIEDAPLSRMNQLLRPYLKVDADGGSFALYSQLRISHGRIEGYLKPLLKNLKVHIDQKGGLGRKLYNRMVQAASNLLENRKSDEVATEITFNGRTDSPRFSSSWQVVSRLVQNAFLHTILPGFEKQARRKT